MEKSVLALESKFFENGNEPVSEVERQLAHVQENLIDAKKGIDNKDSIYLIDTALERIIAAFMHLDSLKK